ncbi:S8 family serine peptidase [Candidatus Bipolaricaulota sp. J31]
MRKSLVLIVLLLLGYLALAGPERLDPLLRTVLRSWKEIGTEGIVALDFPRLLSLGTEDPAVGVPTVRVLIRTRTPGAAYGLPGFHPETVIGDLATGTASLTALEGLADHPEVVYIQASRPLRTELDISVPEIGAPEVWSGAPPTKGEGVIVGIVDTGIDLLHPSFRVDRDGDGTLEGSRVLWLWDQSAAGVPDNWPLGYGEDFSREEIEWGIAHRAPPSRDTRGHGTHVTGIAAGSEPTLPGVAPGADLVVVKTTFYEDTVVDGVQFVFRVAESLGLPAVVNLSLGGHGGPHDGTSLFEQAIDATLDRPGRAVVVAAGNEAEDKIHVGGEIWSPITWHIAVGSPSGEAHFWHGAGASFQVNVAFGGGEFVVPPGGQRAVLIAGTTLIVENAPYGPDPRNGDKRIYVAWIGAPGGTYIALTFVPAPLGGRVDGWVSSPDYGHFVEGGPEMTIAEPGNAFRVITVGAYVTRNRWISQAGEQISEYRLWELAPFSSHGPTRDGRLKPDLVAPGAWILSARSADAAVSPWLLHPDGTHYFLAGTSMAAPHVAGICALLLSLAPDSTWEELRAALIGGAREDRYTGWDLPDQRWGYGKAYAPAAVEELSPPAPGGTPALEVLSAPATAEALFRYALPAGTSWAELRIYDILGRLVFAEELSPGGRIARWDLLTSGGVPVANGIYLAVLVTEAGTSIPVTVVVQR